MTSEREIRAVLGLLSPMLAAAIENARHELPVYAVRPRSKRPLHKGWQRSATTKPEHLARVWRTAPAANVGIACRDLVVLDADSQRGEDAVADLGLPPTTTVKTARGAHYYFAGRGPTIPKVLDDVEARGSGSGVLGAGSVHPSGADYEWSIPPWEVSPIPLPDQLRALIDQRTTVTPDLAPQGFVLRGHRNNHLTRFAGSLRGRWAVGDLLPVLQAINATQCRPPLSEAEVEKIARSASRWPYPPFWTFDPVTFCSADPRLSLKARTVLWLLCGHANDRGECFPSARHLSELSGIRPNTVTDAIRELEAGGRIKVERRSRRVNRYTLLPWKPLEESLYGKGGSYVSLGDTDGRGKNGRGQL